MRSPDPGLVDRLGRADKPARGLSRPARSGRTGLALGRWRWLVPVTVVAATTAWVAGALSGRADGPVRLALVLLGAGLTGLTAALPLWQHRRASLAGVDAIHAAEDARAAMRVTLEDALDPVVHLIGRIGAARGRDKARRRGEAIQLTVNTIAALTDAERVRVCCFIIEEGPPDRLRADGFAGRAGAPVPELVAGTLNGNAALRVARQGQWIFIDDASAVLPPFRWDVARDPLTAVLDPDACGTVLIGPVSLCDVPRGLLILDASSPGELACVDLPLLRLFTALLGIALRS